jgi:DHA1 family bicyclomycin/chloramphenicol resistance-like MFS transporter
LKLQRRVTAYTFPMNPNSLLFTIFLGVLAALPALSIDISAPTLVLLPRVLGTSKLVANLTVSLFMGGFALGQFSGGSLSDRHGRKPVLLLGLVIYSTAGMACSLSSSGGEMIASRLVQGIGAGMCAVLSFAIVQDLFEGAAARSKRAYVTIVLGAAPILAPAMGSVLVRLAGWRSIHVVLAIGGVVLLAIVRFWLAESRPTLRMVSRLIPADAEPLWHDSRFVSLAIVNALSYAAVFAYIAGAPVVVMGYYHETSRVYAAVFACTAAALMAGAWAGARLSRRGVTAKALLSVTLAASAASTFAMAAASFTSPAISGPAAVCLLVIIQFCRGIIAPNLQHLAIERQEQRAGAASAAVGVSQLLGGALSSVGVAGLLSGFGTFAVAGPMMLAATAAWVTWWWTTRGDLGLGSGQPLCQVSG